MKDLSDSEEEEAYVPTDGEETPEEKDTQDYDILDVETRQPAAKTGKKRKRNVRYDKMPFPTNNGKCSPPTTTLAFDDDEDLNPRASMDLTPGC
jgi:hypothetical protein